MYPVHTDKDGAFQELARSKDVVFGQLSLLRINPGSKRGFHYHTRKQEWFCCIRGECNLETRSTISGETNSFSLKASEKEFVGIRTFDTHYLENKGSEICEVLIIISEEYDEKDPDTLPHEF